MLEFIVGDVHGQFELLQSLLVEAKVLFKDREGVLHRDRSLIQNCYQIGDLIDGRVDSAPGDFHCLNHAEEWFDNVIIGNHELPYLVPGDVLPWVAFNGFHYYPAFAEILQSLERKKVYIPAMTLGDFLVTHAGLGEWIQWETKETALSAINRLWENGSWSNEILTGIPKSRGGRDKGGIFWNHWEDPQNNVIKQIVGHTNLENGPDIRYNSEEISGINIDTEAKSGKKLTGLLLKDGKPFEFIQRDPWTTPTLKTQ